MSMLCSVRAQVFQDGSDSAYPRSVESLGMSEASIKKSIGMGGERLMHLSMHSCQLSNRHANKS